MSSICFCIPARFESTRLNKKLLLKFNNESCINLTIKNVMKSEYFNSNNIYVFTDSSEIIKEIKNSNVNIVLTNEKYKNGSERISQNLNYLKHNYDYIVNIQADEPFISSKNIDHAIKNHLLDNKNIFYTTLHEENNSKEYLESSASLKLVTDSSNNVLYYSRNIIPWNKNNIINEEYTYKTFTGIYIFNYDKIKLYSNMNNTDLQNEEDCEQLKILENGFKIKSYKTVEFNEISLNTLEDYKYLYEKYKNV